MGRRRLALTGAVLALLAATPASAQNVSYAGLTYQDLLRRPTPAPSAHIPYGPERLQFVELWLPKGPGPFPVAIMLHGGCWRADLPGLELMNLAAADLARRGVAVWNIEYRRVGEAGGGYPGTYADVAKAVDLLPTEASKYGLKLDRIVAIGHSAGGHLALWAAARRRLPATSPLKTGNPLKIDAVVTLGGFSDLKRQHDAIASPCGRGVVEAMTGQPGPGRPDVFADTSPAALLPIGARQILVHGAWDPISPPTIDLAYAGQASRLGDRIERRIKPQAGHFELIAPPEPAWTSTAELVVRLLK